MATRKRAAAKDGNGTGDIGDVIMLRGCIEMQLRNAFTDEPVGERMVHNSIMTVGRAWVLQKIGSWSNQTNAINAIAVGTSTATLATSNTALASEITATVGRLTVGTFTTTNMTSAVPSWRAEVLFATDQAVNTIGEIALFNTSAATAGTMFARSTFATFDKKTSNTLAVSYTISN